MEILSANPARSETVSPPPAVPASRACARAGDPEAEAAVPVGPPNHSSHLRFVSAVQEHDPCPYRTGRRTSGTPPLQSCGGSDPVGAPAHHLASSSAAGAVTVDRMGEGAEAAGEGLRAAVAGAGGRPRAVEGGPRPPRPAALLGRITRFGRLAASRWTVKAPARARSARRGGEWRPNAAQPLPLPAAGDGEFEVRIFEGTARVRYVVRDGLITRARYWGGGGQDVRTWGEGEPATADELTGATMVGEEPARPVPWTRRRLGRWRRRRHAGGVVVGSTLAPASATGWQRMLRWWRPAVCALLGIAAALAGVVVGSTTR